MKESASLRANWNKVINIGCTHELPALNTIRIQVVNGAAILLSLSQLIILFVRIYYREPFEITYILNLLIGFIVFPVLYFNSKKNYGTAKGIFFISALLLMTFICWNHAVRGRVTNTELVLVPCSIFCVLLFDGAIKYISFLTIFCCYLFVVVVRVQTQRPGAELTRDDFMNPLLAFITVFVLTSLYLMAYNRVQKVVLTKNEELNQQKEEILTQSEKLQELNEQKDKLFTIISHDLRNPLNSMNGLIELLAKGWISEQDFKQQLPQVSKNLSATSDLLNNLLLWSKSQLQGEVQKPTHFEISALVKSVMASVESQSQQKRIAIQNNVNENMVHADADMIAIVLRNLLTNSIKFSREGERVLISASQLGNYLQMCMQDFGTGIEKDDLNSIFDFRFKSTKGTMNERGTGLGLVLCKDFVEKNGGKIWAESESGSGSKFFFTIPR